jgi:hypothetical protein
LNAVQPSPAFLRHELLTARCFIDHPLVHLLVVRGHDRQVLSDIGLLTVAEQPRLDGADNGKTLIMLIEELILRNALLAEMPASIRDVVQAIAQRYAALPLDQLLREIYRCYPDRTYASTILSDGRCSCWMR